VLALMSGLLSDGKDVGKGGRGSKRSDEGDGADAADGAGGTYETKGDEMMAPKVPSNEAPDADGADAVK